MRKLDTHLGALIPVLFDELLEVYGDAELAAVAAAAIINDLLAKAARADASSDNGTDELAA